MKMFLIIAASGLVLAIVIMWFNIAKEKGKDEQKLTQFEILLKDKENDQKIAARPPRHANDLLIRMRAEND